ncbi:MAG: tRNA (5-methylaminomethyl-2-thiouridine)(34)-methyltransferase MnmD [Bacteroidales bacterium]|nr:tRNA (5-methylaminomethyl-2-thiouridine)(34)-methyltransferase MnmD [Bacteroidales bacterium]
MNTEIISTSDGSCTLRNEHFGETYHSINGAVAESMHIFINLGLRSFHNQNISILEIGYGTGLNAMLSFIENKSLGNTIFYHGIEKFPIDKETFLQFVSHSPDISAKLNTETATKFCDNWNSEIEINPNFKLLKQEIDFEDFSPSRKYDLIYFDAFSPDTQPEMWTLENLRKIINNLTDGGIFVTYCSKGILKQNLRNLNMIVKRIQGPKGKRHVIRATKDINFYT